MGGIPGCWTISNQARVVEPMSVQQMFLGGGGSPRKPWSGKARWCVRDPDPSVSQVELSQ